MIRHLKNQCRDKKILILGLGKEGESSYLFFRRLFPKSQLFLADQKPLSLIDSAFRQVVAKDSFATLFLGKNYLHSLESIDMIIKTPGIPPTLPEIMRAKKRGVLVTSQTELFFDYCHGTIIGITGTKGKSTTTSIIYEVLKAGGKKAFLVGNIGNPVLPFLTQASPDSWFVCELSSHQLSKLNKSPHIAVLLNLYPEHLDYYKNFEEYKAAKARITLFQTQSDYFIYRSSDPHVAKIASRTKAAKIPFRINREQRTGCFIEKEKIVILVDGKKETIMPVPEIPLAGRFNIHNVMPAIIIGRLLKISSMVVRHVIKDFQPLEYRLKPVGTYRGITFYNDPLATIPQATLAALDTLDNQVETLMLGGHDRGIDYRKFVHLLLLTSIRTIILFPTSGQRLYDTFKTEAAQQQKISFYFVDNMKDAVRIAYQKTRSGKICLHSPAAPSCGVGFKDYKERGGLFEKHVTSMQNSTGRP